MYVGDLSSTILWTSDPKTYGSEVWNKVGCIWSTINIRHHYREAKRLNLGARQSITLNYILALRSLDVVGNF